MMICNFLLTHALEVDFRAVHIAEQGLASVGCGAERESQVRRFGRSVDAVHLHLHPAAYHDAGEGFCA